MKLDDVMDEVALVMGEITGLRVSAYPPGSVVGPAGWVGYPQSIDFDETYRRGTDQFTDLPIVLVVGKPTDKSSREKVTEWSKGSGANSVKAVMEAHAWESCDDLTVNACEFDAWEIAGVPYLVAMFTATVVGPGEE
jgi:hypothetical protein